MSDLKPLVLAAAAALTATAHAGDKEVLDLLVKKGVITAEERAKLLEESKAKSAAAGIDRVFPKQDTTKRLTFSGYVQSQYQSFDSDLSAGAIPTQGGFIMRRLYLEFLADVGEGFSGNVVVDLSGNTTSSSTSWLDRAIASKVTQWGAFDVGYRKVAWGYEESTLSSLFKASSSQLLTVERGITNRYWNESENGRRLGFGAHHTGLHFSSTPEPQGLEYGVSLVNAAQGRVTEGGGQNDVAVYANLGFNWKVSDFEKYAIGVNYGRGKFYDNTTANANTSTLMSGYNPFIQAQYSPWTLMAELMTTKLDAVSGVDRKPEGYNATLIYKVNDNWEAVARYTSLDTDGRGQKISDGERGYKTVSSTLSDAVYNKSDAVYLGFNYYFTLSAAGTSVSGHNAKFQLGYERANFDGWISGGGGGASSEAKADVIRAQFQVAF